MKVFLILFAIYHFTKLGVWIARHGETDEREINFGHQLITTLIFWSLAYFCGLFEYL